MNKMEWISVEDRLPEIGLMVLVGGYINYNSHYKNNTSIVSVGEMLENNDFFTDVHRLYGVTHWMPLPEPPEDE